MIRYSFLVLAVTLFVIAILSSRNLFAQGLQNEITVKRPDFSGKWKMDYGRSRFSAKKSEISKDDVFEIEIRQDLPIVVVKMHFQTNRGGAESSEFEFYTDGRSSKDKSLIRRVATWEKSKLILQTYEGRDDLVGEQHFEMLSGGNTLQITFKLTEGRWGYNPNQRPNVIDEYYTDYIVFNRIRN